MAEVTERDQEMAAGMFGKWGRKPYVEDVAAALATAREEGRAAARAELMPTDDLTITKDPRRCGGDPTVGPTRICVHDIVCHLRLCDDSVEAYLADYPHHTQAQVQAALDYYREHPEEIDEILRERREDFNERLALQEAARAAQEALLAAARREGAEEERRACVAAVEEYAQRARHEDDAWDAGHDAAVRSALTALRKRGETPGILGCMPDLTGGRTTLEYLETIRDGEDDG